MSLALLRQRVETEIKNANFVLDAAPAHIKWSGVSDNTTAPYIAVMIEDAGSLACVGNTQRRYVGNVVFTIATQKDRGTNSERVAADGIVTHFGDKLINGIQYGAPQFRQVSSEIYRLYLPYQFDN